MELSRKQDDGWRSIFGIAGAVLVACTACCLPAFVPVLAWLGIGGAALVGSWGTVVASAGAVMLVVGMVKRQRQRAGRQTCASGACASGCSAGSQQLPDNQILPPPVACTLSAVDFKERAEWLKALKERALISHRVEDNCAYLRYKLEVEDDVALMVRQEQACCSFLRFDLRCTPTALELTVTAPPDAGVDAQLLFAHLVPEQSHR